MGKGEELSARRGAVQHARAALETEDMSEANYHVKEAIQLLDLHAYSDEDR